MERLAALQALPIVARVDNRQLEMEVVHIFDEGKTPQSGSWPESINGLATESGDHHETGDRAQKNHIE
ncbi:hypothetical protein [Nocardiopsis dassonvillei]|uniref:hypothetical protein n=1 Tax=Nocardiopsis dassonvillei TaxID=2014 RepID=UPI003F554215